MTDDAPARDPGPDLRAVAVIPAGGSGSRMGGRRKQYLELGGEPILLRAVRPFLEHPRVDRVIIALPPEDAAEPPAYLPDTVTVVAGGPERGDSVRLGLAAVPEDAGIIVIHDAARPLVTREVIDRVLHAAARGTGAVAAIRVTDTLKRADEGARVSGTVERAGLWRAQTPQAFPREMILDACARAAQDGFQATDDAGLVERYGGHVVVVEGSPMNIKVTTSADLALAELLLGGGAG